jgi:hypothetical protein
VLGLCLDFTSGDLTNSNVVQRYRCADGNTNQIWLEYLVDISLLICTCLDAGSVCQIQQNSYQMRTVVDPRSIGPVIKELEKEHVVPLLQVSWLSVEGKRIEGVVSVISTG